ncbi:hypothetical protein MRX96_044224 [Rhipicephalus microplus]
MELVVSTYVGDESVHVDMIGPNHVDSSEPAAPSVAASWSLVVSTCVGDESVLADMLGPNHVESSEPVVPSAAASWSWWCQHSLEMKAC